MKKYTYNTSYRGQQITLQVCAKSAKEAGLKLGINTYAVRKYCLAANYEEVFEGVIGYFEFGVHDEKLYEYRGQRIDYERLKAIIDSVKDKSYGVFMESIGN